MSFKTTGVLLLILALLGSYVYVYGVRKPPPSRPPTPYVYQYEMTDIVRMEVRFKGDTVSMAWDEGGSQWKYADPSKGEVDSSRANGIRLLLSGPGAHRVLVQESPAPSQLSEYGLVNPELVATITLKNGQVHRVLIGDRTPDGRNYYTKNGDSDSIYLVDFTWGDEIKRFVTEPPNAKAPQQT